MTTPPIPRYEFPVADRFRYIDHATMAAPPTMVAHAIAREASGATMLGSTAEDRRIERLERVRADAAAVLGVHADDVTFTGNTTQGMSLVATGLAWKPGDVVVVADRDHPLTTAPWHALADRGVEVRTVPVDEPSWSVEPARFADALEAADGRARAVVVSWVNAARGWRHDLAPLADLAHAHGALLVVDLIQGLGVIPADLTAWGVDAAVAGGHKWLLGPEGTGLLHTSAALRAHLHVAAPSWSSLAEQGERWRLDLDLDPTGRRFEGGTRNNIGTAGLGATIDMLLGVGIEVVWDHVSRWGDQLVAGLDQLGATVVSDRSPGGRSAIVTATFADHDPDALVEHLLARGIAVAARGGGVRFAPHGWNDDDDLAATLDAVANAWSR